jgi:glycine cleavage system H protein
MEEIIMNYPVELKYTKDHEWMKMEGNIAVIGISDFAQDALGDVVFINLPQVGDTVTAGESFGDVESVKAVSDVNSPVTGVIVAVNEELEDSPEMLNEDPYGAWIIKVENVTDEEELLDAAAYEAFCAEEG